MTKVGLIWFFFLLLTSAYAQKVKYKDVFALLSTKQYEQAEPFLKKYLKANDDNPNAFLFMGITFQEKSAKNDILKQTALAVANMDSAIIFYEKAHKMIDEREVRKNKEYYQAYNRRDLRTGEFGVKHSDVLFDLEKRIEGLRERIGKIKMIKHHFVLADTLCKKCHRLFQTIRETYPAERQLYLRADENTVNGLKLLASRFDSCMMAFDQYKTSSAALGKTGYNQQLEFLEVGDFTKVGLTTADFYQNDVRIWDYKKFADKSLGMIEREIFPMREHLIAYDIEINKLRDKLNTDSVSVRSDLTKLIDRLLYDQLRKIDPQPLPMSVFSLKTTDLEYRSVLIENRVLRDSADVHLQLALTEYEIKLLDKLDSIAASIPAEVIEQKAEDYKHFINNTYNNTVVLKSYVAALKEFAVREKRDKEAELVLRSEALHWIIDGADSIPLTQESSSLQYKPLITVDEKYTAGLYLKDSLNASGYFYTITAQRIPGVKAVFAVDKASFKERRLQAIKSLSYVDASDQLFFVLFYSNQLSKDKYPATLAKIYRSDGLAWSNNYQLPFIPKEITLKSDTGVLMIVDETGQSFTIDKNGKSMK